jgi:hypothetical protein
VSTCWKCGKAAPHGTAECEQCETGVTVERGTASLREPRFRQIDLDKIKTPADVRALFDAMRWLLHISEDHPQFDKVRRFLKS